MSCPHVEIRRGGIATLGRSTDFNNGREIRQLVYGPKTVRLLLDTMCAHLLRLAASFRQSFGQRWPAQTQRRVRVAGVTTVSDRRATATAEIRKEQYRFALVLGVALAGYLFSDRPFVYLRIPATPVLHRRAGFEGTPLSGPADMSPGS